MNISYDRDNEAPATDTMDLRQDYGGPLPNDRNWPLRVSMKYWVHSLDLIALGAFTVSLVYVDVKGTTRTITGGGLVLTLGTSLIKVEPEIIYRPNAGALIQIVTTSTLTLGSPTVSSRILLEEVNPDYGV